MIFITDLVGARRRRGLLFPLIYNLFRKFNVNIPQIAKVPVYQTDNICRQLNS